MSFLKNKKAQWITTLSLASLFGLYASGVFESDYTTETLLDIETSFSGDFSGFGGIGIDVDNCELDGRFRGGLSPDERLAVLVKFHKMMANDVPAIVPFVKSDLTPFSWVTLECDTPKTPAP